MLSKSELCSPNKLFGFGEGSRIFSDSHGWVGSHVPVSGVAMAPSLPATWLLR